MPAFFLVLLQAFLFSLGLLWLARSLESHHSRRTRIQPLETPPATLSISQAFNPIYAILWEAPLAALRLIESSGPSGIRAARVQPIFSRAAACFPEIYDGYTFWQWLEFLEETGLIVWSGDRVKITPEGRAFLTYRFVTDTMVAA
jgi:hypothetical protein